jgi:hypothetical protein
VYVSNAGSEASLQLNHVVDEMGDFGVTVDYCKSSLPVAKSAMTLTKE